MNIVINNCVSKRTISRLFFLGRKKYNNNFFNISPFSTVKDGLTSYKGKNYPKETFTTFPVRWGDQDAMDHVNNVVYFQYLNFTPTTLPLPLHRWSDSPFSPNCLRCEAVLPFVAASSRRRFYNTQSQPRVPS